MHRLEKVLAFLLLTEKVDLLQVRNGFVNFGRMPVADASAMYRARDEIGIDYVIYSYKTAIAYRTTGGEWTIPDAKYSVTTSKHQGTIRYALSMIGAR